VASADCASGACTTFYTDADGDGFVSSSGSGFCGTTPPPGWTATQGNDCCDSDSTAYPGVTIFFSSPRNGCGGYDFNCSGAEEVVLLPFVVDPCSVDSCTSGWSSTVPDCGDSAPWQNCTTNAKGVCVTASPTTKIQICH
jgi:hypothetical protein